MPKLNFSRLLKNSYLALFCHSSLCSESRGINWILRLSLGQAGFFGWRLRMAAYFFGFIAVTFLFTGCSQSSEGPDGGTVDGSQESAYTGYGDSPQAAGRFVIASYYSWYTNKPSQWTSDLVKEHPIIGPYMSSDPNLLDYEISMASEAGVDAFSWEWYLPGDRLDTQFRQAIGQIENSEWYPDFKLAALYSGAVSERNAVSAGTIIESLSYIIREYGGRRAVLKADGRPVIFIYSPQNKTPAEWRDIFSAVGRMAGPAFYIAFPDTWDIDFGAYLDVFDSIGMYADKYYSEADLIERYSQVSRIVKPAGGPLIVTAFGGGSRIVKLGFDIDRSGGKFIQRRFDMAGRLNADWINVTSWNEWFEGNQIEPSREYGFEQVKYLREAISRFKGRDLPSLDGAGISLGVASPAVVSATNTGRQDLYYVTCGGGKSLVAYMLHPGETRTSAAGGAVSCAGMTGYLVDGTAVSSSR